jgi:hypothetical protein
MPEVAQEGAGMPTMAMDKLEHRQPRVGCSRALTERGRRCYRHNLGGSERWAERQDELKRVIIVGLRIGPCAGV